MSIRIPLPAAMFVTFTVAAIALVALLAAVGVIAAQGDPLAALPDNVVLASGDAAMLNTLRNSPILTAARANYDCGCWQMERDGVWVDLDVTWEYIWMFDSGTLRREYYVVAARVPGGWLLLTSAPRASRTPAEIAARVWHGKSVAVVGAGG